jgi:hypothetical protein
MACPSQAVVLAGPETTDLGRGLLGLGGLGKPCRIVTFQGCSLDDVHRFVRVLSGLVGSCIFFPRTHDDDIRALPSPPLHVHLHVQVLEYSKLRSRVTSNAIDSLQAACGLIRGVGGGFPELLPEIKSELSDDFEDEDSSQDGVPGAGVSGCALLYLYFANMGSSGFGTEEYRREQKKEENRRRCVAG